VANFNAEQTRRIGQLESLLSYLKKRMVPKNMFKQVREYYEFLWEGGNAGSESQQQLEALPESIQIQLASEMHKRLLAQIPVFNNLSSRAAFFLVKNWANNIYVPGDVIVKRIGQDDRLHIVIRGTVRVYLANADTRRQSVIHRAQLTLDGDQEAKANEGFFFAQYETGKYFGEEAMFSNPDSIKGRKRHKSAVAVTHSELLYITREIFKRMVERFNLQSIVKGIRKTYRQRQAAVMWRVAIAKVRVVIRLTRLSQHHANAKKKRHSSMITTSFSRKPASSHRPDSYAVSTK